VDGMFTIKAVPATPLAITQRQAFERPEAGPDFAFASYSGGAQPNDAPAGDNGKNKCTGVLGPSCAASIHPDNRNLGPHVGWAEEGVQ